MFTLFVMPTLQAVNGGNGGMAGIPLGVQEMADMEEIVNMVRRRRGEMKGMDHKAVEKRASE